MWKAMVKNIINNWFEVFVYNRTKSKLKELIDLWAIATDSIWDLVKKSDIIFTIVWNPKSVEEVYYGDNWIIKNIGSEKIVIDMTTTKPSLTIEISKDLENKWVKFLDAPVSWWELGAINWSLSIMVWWDNDLYNFIEPIFSLMWSTITYCWAISMWQQTKMANQISIAWNTIALCEALVYSEKVWLDPINTIKVVSSWAGWSWWWTNLSTKIVNNELDTNFYIKHFIKDLKIVLEECDKYNLSLPWLTLVHELYKSMVSYWYEDLWTHALIKIIRKLNNIDE